MRRVMLQALLNACSKLCRVSNARNATNATNERSLTFRDESCSFVTHASEPNFSRCSHPRST